MIDMGYPGLVSIVLLSISILMAFVLGLMRQEEGFTETVIVGALGGAILGFESESALTALQRLLSD